LVKVTVGLHGPPLHLHRNEDEVWYVLDGDFEMRIGEHSVPATPGSVVFGPKGVPHQYIKLSEGPGTLLEIFSPAGFERCFEEIAGLTDIGRMREIALTYGMEMLGPPSMR
jgi:mannose-6-phosphate isomerase-like protein (cupin superfamily)